MFWMQIKCISRIGWNHIKVNMYLFVFDLWINLNKKIHVWFYHGFCLFRLQHLFPVLKNTTLTFKTNPMSRLKQMHIHPWHTTNLSHIYHTYIILFSLKVSCRPVLTNTTLTFKTNPMSRLKQMHIHPGHTTNLSHIYLRSMWLCAPVFVLSDNVFAQYCQQNSHVLDIYCILFWTRLENLLLVLCFPAVRQYCVSDKVFPNSTDRVVILFSLIF